MNQRRYSFSQVDAFTLEILKGNPCAIILDADDLTDAEMQSIAREMNLSETSFVFASSKADFKFRYFTPSEEIPLAGHPTIATVFRLLEIGRVSQDKKNLRIELKAGIIDVRIENTNLGPKIVMEQLPPQFGKVHRAEEVLPLFGLSMKDLSLSSPIQTVSTGTPMLMIPLKEISALDRISFDAFQFQKYKSGADFFSAHLFALNENETVARHFCAPPDVIEDPFTGSASGAMGCYLWKHKLIKNPEFTAHQGEHLHRPGKGYVKVLGSPDSISGVEVAGYAVTCLQGELLL